MINQEKKIVKGDSNLFVVSANFSEARKTLRNPGWPIITGIRTQLYPGSDQRGTLLWICLALTMVFQAASATPLLDSSVKSTASTGNWANYKYDPPSAEQACATSPLPHGFPFPVKKKPLLAGGVCIGSND